MAARSSECHAGWAGGWWWHARRRPSPHHGPRPRGTVIELAVVHSISLPPGEYGGPAIEALFRGTLDCEAHPYYSRLQGLRVSAHFVVRRNGEVLQFVSCDRRAWHAGASRWRQREGCNDWSVGIELEGLEGDRFEPAQYAALARLLRALTRRYPVREVVGHEHVAPGRKHDPGPGFDWRTLRSTLRSTPPSRDLWLIGDRPAAMRAVAADRATGRSHGRDCRARPVPALPLGRRRLHYR